MKTLRLWSAGLFLAFAMVHATAQSQYAIKTSVLPLDSVGHQIFPTPTPQGGGTSFSYFWWFGDNYFSFGAAPTHRYRAGFGSHAVYAALTENYSSSGPPPMATTVAPSGPVAGSNVSDILPSGTALKLQHYRQAVPGSHVFLIASYASDWEGEGSLSVQIDPAMQQYFTLPNTVPPEFTPNGENHVAGTLNWNFTFDPLQHDRSVLIPLEVSAGIGAAMYSPIPIVCSLAKAGQVITTDTVTLYAMPSHDPNAMIPGSTEDEDCMIDGETFRYDIHFQNTGDGPTSRIVVKAFFDDRLDVNSLRTLGFHENIPLCPTQGTCYEVAVDPDSNKVTWSFDNLVLLGTGQPDCDDPARTKGHIALEISGKADCAMGDDLSSYADIYFDANPKIRTNDAVTSCPEEYKTTDPCDVPQTAPAGTSGWWWVVAALALLAVAGAAIVLRSRSNTQ